ncbi:MAG TPA: EamA family transporter [Propylenella sp.]
MTAAVTFAVLVAAFCHASWNAMIRMRGDKLVTITLLVAAAGLMALPGLLVVPVLPAAAWPYLIASAIIHVGYNTFLALSYHHGELTKVYPLVRGSAPLTTLVVSLLFLDEAVNGSEIAGIVVLATGIMALTLDRGWRALISSPQILVYAGATSLCITAYTVSDGLGARAAGNAHHYVIWLFVVDAVPMVLAALLIRRQAFIAAVGANWIPGLLGGALSLAAYWIVIWAFTVAPIPIVAALRETSILFALLIGMIWLGEKVTSVRAASIVTVLCGLALMQI